MQQIIVGQNNDGGLVAVYTTATNALYYFWQDPPTLNVYSKPMPLGNGNFAKQMAIGRNGDGRLEIFYVGTNNDLYHNWQTAPGEYLWSGETRMSNASAIQIAVGMNSNGHLSIFYIGTNNHLYFNTQVGTNQWGGEKPFGIYGTQVANNITQMVATNDQNGSFAVFYAGGNGTLLTAQNGSNGSWVDIGSFGRGLKQFVVGQNSDGRLERFYIGITDNVIYHQAQITPNDNYHWSNEILLGQVASLATQIAVARNQDGRLILFSIGLDGNIYYHIQTTTGNSTWSSATIFGPAANAIAVGTHKDQSLDLFYINKADGLPYHYWQNGPNGSWSGPKVI